MKQLRYLNLSDSYFSGMIPHHLGNLSNLQVLDLSGLRVGLCADDMGWVAKLASLRHITMTGVFLKKAHNLFQVLSMLPSLLQAEFSSCGIANVHVTHASMNSTFLPNIELLDLSFNHLHGSIPNALQNMTSLRELDLSGNSISSIPHWLCNFHSLIHLDLSWNSFNESKISISSILNNICSLQSLDLSGGKYESLVSLLSFGSGNLSQCSIDNFEELFLSSNGINESLPSWLGELKNLKTLYLSNNLLYGPMPSWFGELESLETLDLSNNSLCGPIPVNLGKLSNLVKLDLSHNLLEGTFYENHLEKLINIQSLQLGFNNLFVKIDSNWTPPFQSLTQLGMTSCNIGTKFPQWLRKQKRLVHLDLSNNSIRGQIPKYIGDQNIKLRVLDLKHNFIEGSIPNSLCNLEKLITLRLSYNRLSGEIPNCWSNTSQIRVINLSSNKLSGTIPSTFWNLSYMMCLILSNNNLHGDLQQVLQRHSTLEVLDLGENQFTGMIPSWIGDGGLPLLHILRMSQNFLCGDIPPSLCKLQRLGILDLSGSNLSGSIPSCFCILNGTNQFNPEYGIIGFDDEGVDVIFEEGVDQVLKGLQHEYTSNLMYLTNIDLSNNNLKGSIPEGLTCFSSLIGLNLSHNKFSGKIPSKISNMKSLESIDLSSNQLFGPIPSNMSTLTSLGFLNLSNNNFSGPIPEGAQFSTFGPSSYNGNPYLCGDLLGKSCPGIGIAHPPSNLSFHEEDDDKGKEKVLFYFVIALGFITGFWVVIGFLLLNKKWRHACFRHVDNFVDFMYVEIHIRKARFKNKCMNLVAH
ncbi:receptor-like protein EIX1 [Prosopis cineraria]|uniref:receptor-like protein EIX1 n=1 Tax=Prosopis cineraria TaxID=364024 RepID=UPI00240F757C|nr:receptor-like protein EIX1 [Prosopis cineraria]